MTKPAILILGATSDIGRAVARTFAAHGHAVHLAARDAGRLAHEAEDLRIRTGMPVTARHFDVLDATPLELANLDPPPGIVVCVVGLLGDHRHCIAEPAAAELVMRTNYLGPALALESAARHLEARGGGTILAVGSVAGDRGRAGNYVYGSAKAGLAAYLSGLRARLHGSGIRVVTLKPGFVDTRMTAGMNLPKALTAQPEEVAAAILRACRAGPEIVYVRPIWRWIMTIIRLLPEPLFKRLKF
jgi:decaprenylphospho-beta-D-erythro-pentofuranosid-2-ulose 2-reductase